MYLVYNRNVSQRKSENPHILDAGIKTFGIFA